MLLDNEHVLAGPRHVRHPWVLLTQGWVMEGTFRAWRHLILLLGRHIHDILLLGIVLATLDHYLLLSLALSLRHLDEASV